MKKNRFSAEQIVAVLKHAELGVPAQLRWLPVQTLDPTLLPAFPVPSLLSSILPGRLLEQLLSAPDQGCLA